MMDFILEAWTSSLIELSRALWMLGAGRPWQPGEPLKLLFAGYNGTRNTGSDVRVEEMLRQVRRVLGEKNVALSVMTFDPERSRGYFSGTTQVQLPMNQCVPQPAVRARRGAIEHEPLEAGVGDPEVAPRHEHEERDQPDGLAPRYPDRVAAEGQSRRLRAAMPRLASLA